MFLSDNPAHVSGSALRGDGGKLESWHELPSDPAAALRTRRSAPRYGNTLAKHQGLVRLRAICRELMIVQWVYTDGSATVTVNVWS